jgi:carbonic anhydrase
MKKTTLYLLTISMILTLNASMLWSSSPGLGITPEEAMSKLQEGNARFTSGALKHPNQDQVRRSLTAAKGQQPFATVLGCSDSRVPVEVLFDAGIGDIFVIRVAGNVADIDEAGSIEYGVDHLGTPLLVVLGHTRCGAVTAVLQNAQLHGCIPTLVENCKPAIEKAKAAHPELSGDALVDEAVKSNVLQVMDDLFKLSEAIRNRTKEGKVKVVGAIYDIESGKINWMGPHPEQDRLIAGYGASGSTHK